MLKAIDRVFRPQTHASEPSFRRSRPLLDRSCVRPLTGLLLAAAIIMPMPGYAVEGGAAIGSNTPSSTGSEINTPARPLNKLKSDVARKVLRPDLTVDVVGPQGGFALTIFTHNNGLADAGNFDISFFCDRWIPPKDFYGPCSLPTISVNGLAKGKTDTRKLPHSLFSPSFTYSITAWADKQNKVVEKDETNNSDSIQIKNVGGQ